MVDNFVDISNLLEFTSVDDYYFIQVMVRAKDDPSLGSNNKMIKTYAVRSMDEFDKIESEIKTLCITFKARAYIHLTKRSFKKVALLMMKELCDRITNNQCPEIAKSFNTSSGLYNDSDNKFWIVDIDCKLNGRELNEIVKYIDRECEPAGVKYITTIETKSGYHLITKPFHTQQFKMKYADLDIHKNNPTILYISK